MAIKAEHELHKRRFGRNAGVGLVLAAFVAIVFGLTVVKVKFIDVRDSYNADTSVSAGSSEGESQ